MKIRLLMIVILGTISSKSFAQQIHGIIQNGNGERLASMIVALRDGLDSTFISGSVSNENGEFNIVCDKTALN